jgi:hypothetical protein
VRLRDPSPHQTPEILIMSVTRTRPHDCSAPTVPPLRARQSWADAGRTSRLSAGNACSPGACVPSGTPRHCIAERGPARHGRHCDAGPHQPFAEVVRISTQAPQAHIAHVVLPRPPWLCERGCHPDARQGQEHDGHHLGHGCIPSCPGAPPVSVAFHPREAFSSYCECPLLPRVPDVS